MSQGTDKLRTLFNELTSDEAVAPEVKSKVALALDSLIDIETEVASAEASKDSAVADLEEVKTENARLREYNSQLTMKLGEAIAVQEEPEPAKTEDEDISDDFIEDYEM